MNKAHAIHMELENIQKELRKEFYWVKAFEYDKHNNVLIGYGERILNTRFFIIHNLRSRKTEVYQDAFYDYNGSEDCTTTRVS